MRREGGREVAGHLFKAPSATSTYDVGTLQVRTALTRNRLFDCAPRHKDERAFVLAVGTAPRFRIAGWMWGRDAKQQEFWKDPAGGRPAFFVPQDRLAPIAELRFILKAAGA